MRDLDRDWSDVIVEQEPSKAKVVHSARIRAEVSEVLEAEAARRKMTPSALIAELVEAGLAPQQETVTVRLVDLHRAIDAAVRLAA
jgi:predicted DNA-binding ribbon-helix-helix protein